MSCASVRPCSWASNAFASGRRKLKLNNSARPAPPPLLLRDRGLAAIAAPAPGDLGDDRGERPPPISLLPVY